MVRNVPSAADFCFILIIQQVASSPSSDARNDGLELQQAQARGVNALPVVFLTGEGDIPTSVRAMREGAELSARSTGRTRTFAAVERAIARDACQREENVRSPMSQERIDRLTPRAA